MPDNIERHAGSVRAFYHFGASWYSASEHNVARLDEINIGMYCEDGGTTGEFALVWTMLSGQPVCRLEVFDEAWSALARFPDFLAKLAEFDLPGTFSLQGQHPIRPSQILAALTACGVLDKTRRVPPAATAGPITTPYQQIPARDPFDPDDHFLSRLQQARATLPPGYL